MCYLIFPPCSTYRITYGINYIAFNTEKAAIDFREDQSLNGFICNECPDDLFLGE